MDTITRIVRFSLVGLIVKGESESGLGVVNLELEAPSSGLRSRGESKYGGIIGRIGSVEAKGKEGLRVEREERKSLREGLSLLRDNWRHYVLSGRL